MYRCYPHFTDGETINVKWLTQGHLANQWQELGLENSVLNYYTVLYRNMCIVKVACG